MYRRGLAYLRTIEWASIIGSALVLVFCFLVLLPLWRLSLAWGHTPNANSLQQQLPTKTFWEQATNDPVAFFTLVLAAFTAVLALATVRLWNSTKGLHEETKTLAALAGEQSRDMKASIAAAQKSADAAQLNAEAAVGSETARVKPIYIALDAPIFWHATSDGSEPTIKDMLAHGNVHLKFKNSGRTEADIVAVSVNYHMGTKLPEEPEYGFPFPRGATTAIGANGGEWNTWDHRLKLAPEEIDAVAAGETTVWIYGYLEYLDFMGDLVRKGFCARLGFRGLLPRPPDSPEFYLAGPANYWQATKSRG